ncbi:UNVERIFIED_ORG: hypothetical protein QE446_003909 [Rhizobium sp. SORGH_AS260]|uniref:HEPN domain-containing protein n=1 Tax=Agrobacterium sp. SORGH_AS_0440 TaxID=3041757 RepID=UPI00277DBB79|nr:HEPN domain-containing protein [Agrobacterium sp. SORGH_AS_0440]MDP9732131.1 hypothetical protein [Rhizobium sp. SORGH_AS_0285]MDP9756033.1 hypothetical protein [Rhizobium sp. SORGH_AS_0260]MDR6081304.1 hypothetical protein [Agrobacterium sp. SORGH_AS_0440]
MATVVFELHPSARASIEAIAGDVFSSVRRIEVSPQRQPSNGWWQPDNITTITDDDIVGHPKAWVTQVSGGRAFVFMWEGNHSFGLTQEDFEKLTKLIDAVLKVKWASNSVSTDYVENLFLDWARGRLEVRLEEPFCDLLLRKVAEDIVLRTVTVPIQHLAVEEAFQFGMSRVIPMGPRYFDMMQARLLELNPNKATDVEKFVGLLRTSMADCSALQFEVLAEAGYAQKAALQRAGDAIGLLRFFSVATVASTIMSPVTLLGELSIPKTHVIVDGTDGGLHYSSGIALDNVDYWRVSKEEAGAYVEEGLDAVAGLIDLEKLSDFEKAIRSSILAFSRATTFPELSDRLVFAFSAIEGLMLKNASEPIQQNVGERVAFLTTSVPDKRQAIVENFRRTYKMRSQYIHHRLTTTDVEELDSAFENIRAALSQAIGNIGRFKTKDEFLAAIDRKKFGG